MTEKKKATGTLDGWVAKKNRGDDVDGCTTVATTVVENMECDGNSSSSSSSTTTTTTTTQRLTDVTAISTELNCSASATTTVLSTHPICPLVPSSSSSSSPYHAYNIRDDQHAPREVLDAAIALRIYIHENTEGGMGLIIHRFHIRRRDDGEKKKAPKKGKGRPDDYSDWCVHCDVCDKPNSLVSSFRSNPPLYIFQTQHLGLANHLANGQRLLSSMDNAAEVTKRDDAAAAAAAASRWATAMQEVTSPLPAESARRDATPIKPLTLQETTLGELVTNNPALQWVEEHDDYGNTIASRAMCVWCVYTSKSCADEARLLPELMNHLSSKEHTNLREYRGGLTAIFSTSAGPSSPPPPAPDLTRLCWGFHKSELEVHERSLKTNVLLEYDTSQLDWFAEPNTQEEFESTIGGQPPLVIHGTFRSRVPKCQRYCTVGSGQRLPNLCCPVCANIPARSSFRNALRRRHEEPRDSKKINFKVSFFLLFSSFFF